MLREDAVRAQSAQSVRAQSTHTDARCSHGADRARARARESKEREMESERARGEVGGGGT